MAGDVAFGDAAAAVAVVGDAPVEVGENGGVDTADPTVVAAGGVLGSAAHGAVGGEAAENFEVGFEREGWKRECDARAEEAAVDVPGEIASGVGCDSDWSETGETVVEAEGSGGGPAFAVDLGLLCADGSVDADFGLGVEVGGGDESDQDQGEELKDFFRRVLHKC